MEYQDFLKKVIEELKNELGAEFDVRIHKIHKNNGTFLNGLCIIENKRDIAPIIYLEPYYRQFQNGMSIEEIILDICLIYRQNRRMISISNEFLIDYQYIKDKIIYKLIGIEKNEALLKEIPHIRLCNLAIVFYLILGMDQEGQITSLIYREHMDLWGISVNDLFKHANENTPRILPAVLSTVNDVLKRMTKEMLREDYGEDKADDLWKEKIPLYVLSNKRGICGAAAILYPEMMKYATEVIGCDSLIILPSSVHETLLFPYDGTADLKDLEEMVRLINENEVPEEDVLSDSIYCYSRQDNSIRIIIDTDNNGAEAGDAYELN